MQNNKHKRLNVDIYLLRCPLTKDVLFIGSTIKGGLPNRILHSRSYTEWLKLLRDENKEPIIEIIDSSYLIYVDVKELDSKYFILSKHLNFYDFQKQDLDAILDYFKFRKSISSSLPNSGKITCYLF